MNEVGALIGAVASSLVGSPYSVGGRDPRHGLDCVGLVLASLSGAGQSVPMVSGYGLRNVSIDRWLRLARTIGLLEVNSRFEAGDILLAQPGPAQHHLLVAEHAASFIHAHAGLRRVVRTPAPLPWVVTHHWRMPSAV